MKRFLTLLAVVISTTLVAMAQHPMATLSHNGELTQFTGVHALNVAIDAAQFGDIIYLSAGEFLSSSDMLSIKYGISIVGQGYDSKILSSIRICPTDEDTSEYFGVILDGVSVKSIDVEVHEWRVRENAEIRNCWIEEMYWGGAFADNFYINRCFIENAGFHGINKERNVYVNNSKIKNLDGWVDYIQMTNCNVQKAGGCPRILKNSIIAETADDSGKLGMGDGTHAIYNSFFPSEEFVNGKPEYTSIFNCYFENPANGLLDENLNATIDLQAKGYLGQDGTVIGAYGGEHPFSEYPSVPTIDSEKSSVEFDPASNKLNVTITVASN